MKIINKIEKKYGDGRIEVEWLLLCMPFVFGFLYYFAPREILKSTILNSLPFLIGVYTIFIVSMFYRYRQPFPKKRPFTKKNEEGAR